MAIDLCILASGSAGNCSLLRTSTGTVLIDAGIGPRKAATRLNGTGVVLADVSAICLTHLDRDHFSLNWISTIIRRNIRVFCRTDRVADMLESVFGQVADSTDAKHFASLVVGFDDQRFEPVPDLTFHPVPFVHDRTGSSGFVAEHDGRRIGYATDLGHVPAGLVDRFCGLDVLCIESNYDSQMQQDSPRPWFLKQRITGGRGHLSNQQAFDAVRQIMDRCERRGLALPEHIVLLHRSRQCNCPDLLRNLFGRDARIGPRVTLAEQYTRTEWIRPRGGNPMPGEQLRLAWG